MLAAALSCAAVPLTAQAPATIETRMVEVDGRALRVQTGGWHHRESGRPIVVFQNGMGTSLEAWSPILSRIAEMAPAAVELYHLLKRSHPAERFDEELLSELRAEASADARVANFRRNVERTEQRLREGR